MAKLRFVARMRASLPHAYAVCIVAVMLATLSSGCLGVSGGTEALATKFKGVDSAVVTSPTSAVISWTPVSGYTDYEVYLSTQDNPIGTTVFNNYTVANLTPNTTYSFSVAGVKSSGSKDGIQKQATAQTWSAFSGASSAAAVDAQSVSLAWKFNTGPTFQVFYSANSAPTSVTGTPQLTTQSPTGVVVGGLQPSTPYYFIVTAKYPDGSSSSQKLSSATTLSAQFSSTNLATIPSVTTLASILSSDKPTFTVSGAPFSYVSTFYTGSIANAMTCPTVPTGQVLAIQNGSGTATSATTLPVGTSNVTIQIKDTIITNTCMYGTLSGIVASSAAASSSNKVVQATTPSGLGSLPSVTAASTQFGSFPSFTVNGGLSSYTTTLYYQGPTTPPAMDTVLGSITGISGANSGTIQVASNTPLPRGTITVLPKVSLGSQSVSLSPITIKLKNVDSDAITPNLSINAPPAASGSAQLGSMGGGVGFRSVVGDFNCDGYSDLAVSAPFAPFQAQILNKVTTTQTNYAAGAVMVYYGKPDGSGLQGIMGTQILPKVVPVNQWDPLLIPAPNTNRSGGTGRGQRFGQSLAVGNINGDLAAGAIACSDLVVGAPIDESDNTSVVGVGNHGAAYVYFGSSTLGLQVSNTYAYNSLTCSGGSTCGVGKYGYTLDTSIDPVSSPANGFGANYFGSLGVAVAAGDFNGDGYDDVAVADAFARELATLPAGVASTPTAAGGGSASQQNDGAVLMYLGSPSGLSGRYFQIRMPVKCPNSAGGACNQTQSANFGWSLAFGNVSNVLGNAGTLPNAKDLIIGAPSYLTSNGTGLTPALTNTTVRGAVVIVEGTNALPSTWLGEVVSGAWQGQSYGGHLLPTYNGYYILTLGSEALGGYSVATADVNGDGFSDIITGTPNFDAPNNSDSGTIYVYYGSNTGIILPAGHTNPYEYQNVKTCVAGSFAASCSPHMIFRPEGLRQAGFSLSIANLGDINGDGIDDVGVGAPTANPLQNGGRPDNGMAYIYYGSTTGLSPSPATILNINSPNHSFFGTSIAGGNFRKITFTSGSCNTKKCNDVVVGAAGESPSPAANNAYTVQNPYGAVHVFVNGGNSFAPSVTSDNGVTPYIGGTSSGQHFHLARFVGDLNGDGFSDIASPFNDQSTVHPLNAYQINNLTLPVYESGESNSSSSTNAIWGVVIYYGSATGLVMGDPCIDGNGFAISGCTSAGSGPSLLPISPTAPLLITDRAYGDPTFVEPRLGKQIASAGSMNGDIYSDLLVTNVPNQASNSNFNNNPNLYLYYGSPNGLVTGYATNATPKLIPANQYDPRIINSQPAGGGNNAGISPLQNNMAAHGDFNGDHFGDIAMYVDGPGPNPDEPVIVIYGSADGPVTRGLMLASADTGYPSSDLLNNVYKVPTCTDPNANQNAPCTQAGVVQNAVEICWASAPTGNGRCDSNYAGGSGPVVPPPLSGGGAFSYPTLPLSTGAAGASNTPLANLMSPGDLDKDGTDELVIASNTDTSSGFLPANAGSVLIYYGSSVGIDQRNYVKLNIPLSSNGGGGNRNLGTDIAPAGDVNGDGIADMIIGGTGNENVLGITGSGAAYLIYGINGGYRSNAGVCPGFPCTVNMANTAVFNVPDYFMSNVVEQTDTSCNSVNNTCNPLRFYPDGVGASWRFGNGVLGIGDQTGDGFGEVAVGADRFGSTANPGAVIFSGSQTGLKVKGALIQAPTCTGGVCTPFLVKINYTKSYIPQGNNMGGSNVATLWGIDGWKGTGDIENDGRQDFMIANYYIHDPNGKGFYNGGFFLFH